MSKVDKFFIIVISILAYIIFTWFGTVQLIKLAMRKYPEIYTEEALNKYGYSKKHTKEE